MADTSRWRRSRRVGLWLSVLLAVLVLVFYLGGGWYFSGQIDDRALAGQSRREALAPQYDLEIVTAGAGTLALRLPDDPGSLTTEGVFGIRWDGGYVLVVSGGRNAKDPAQKEVDKEQRHGARCY